MISLEERITKGMDANSVCLVSGGGKGITAQAAIAVARQYQCKFILLGRSSISQPEATWLRDCNSELELKKRILEHLLEQGTKPTPVMVQKEYKAITAKREIEQTLREIESAGGKAEYLSVDVTDETALAAELAVAVERLGSVTAIIHGAGNLADKPIEKKSELDYDIVYAPKVLGLRNLLSCVDPSQLDYLVLFSSVVGFYGNAGQTDYALANDILNKTAHLVKRDHPHCRVVAIDWGPWDSGMVSPQLKQAFAERGIETIPIEVGTQMLVEELATPNQDTQIIIGSPLTPSAIAIDPQLKSYQIRRRLSIAANPFLLDHVIANRPVLPAACAMSWITNSCEQIYPGYKYFGCQQFKVLKGIVFEDNIPQEYILDLTEITKDRDQIEFEARIWSKNQAGKIRYHFSTQLVLKVKIPDSPQYESLNLTPQPQQVIKNDFYQSGGLSLFHGASFQGVQKILNCNEEKITIQCSLPPVASQVQGQFPVQTFNPYILDVQIHSLWLWSQYLHQQICLPSAIAHYEQYASIAFGETFYVSCEIKSKTDTAVVADVIAHKQNGQIYSQMMGARGTIISLPPG
ncbi:MAG: SDR family NAD(P)-dependent oxidoreductase [Xenococcaceae cyanobacterium MO_167.B52]|nr:SDR family NAD(P)-dependent oxidoreductase [Xenococcaceae cyanobacterium MO_167.B52]